MENEFIKNTELDYAEIYRQNFMDAKDEIRNLKFELEELRTENRTLKFENDLLNRQLLIAENAVMRNEGKI